MPPTVYSNQFQARNFYAKLHPPSPPFQQSRPPHRGPVVVVSTELMTVILLTNVYEATERGIYPMHPQA